MRNLQEQVKKAFCLNKLFQFQILGLQPRISKVFLDHYNIFFRTVGQNNFGDKILCIFKLQKQQKSKQRHQVLLHLVFSHQLIQSNNWVRKYRSKYIQIQLICLQYKIVALQFQYFLIATSNLSSSQQKTTNLQREIFPKVGVTSITRMLTRYVRYL